MTRDPVRERGPITTTTLSLSSHHQYPLFAYSRAEKMRPASQVSSSSSSSNQERNTFFFSTPRRTTSLDEPRTTSSSRALIIDGVTVTSPLRFPYFCTLNRYGGGALIAPDVVLTAGHCKPDSKEDVAVRVGMYTFSTHDENTQPGAASFEQIPIRHMFRNSNFTHLGPDEFRWDYTILLLNDTVKNHNYIRINTDPTIPKEGDQLLAMGMGDTDKFRSPSRANTLQMVNLTYLENRKCEKAHSDSRQISYRNRIHPTHLCTTGGPHNERDACNYDSGSPIIIAGNSNSNYYYQQQDDLLVALVSWGEDCADPDFPGVNARVSEASMWIRDIVCQHSVKPPHYLCNNKNDTSSFIPGGSLSTHYAQFFLVLLCVGIVVGYMKIKRSQGGQITRHLDRGASSAGSEYSYGSIHGIET